LAVGHDFLIIILRKDSHDFCGKTAMTIRRSPAMTKILSVASALSLSASFAIPGHAADLGYGAPAAAEIGVPCAIGQPFWAPPAPTAETLPWPSVWYGHFSGGRPYRDVYGRIIVDWRDEKVCFASKASCRSWIGELRRAYHSPEGFWTCSPLR